jgi:hypothetical protein
LMQMNLRHFGSDAQTKSEAININFACGDHRPVSKVFRGSQKNYFQKCVVTISITDVNILRPARFFVTFSVLRTFPRLVG